MRRYVIDAVSSDPLHPDLFGLLHDYRRSDNASRARTVAHLNADIHAGKVFDPPDSSGSLTESMETRSSFVGEQASGVVFE